jgi:Domain of unknown function (DUF4398)
MRHVTMTSIVLTSLFAAGCASGPDIADTGIARAEATIENAAGTGAAEFASTELDTAREKLVQAKLAAEQGDEALAARLAEEAEIDAQVAMARAEHAEAEEAVREVRQGTETLRRELQMNNTPGGAQ